MTETRRLPRSDSERRAASATGALFGVREGRSEAATETPAE